MKIYSVGYNGSGQSFFDYLYTRKDFIHSYFFSPTNNFYRSIDWKKEKQTMQKLETYDFEANILFNLNVSLESREILREFLQIDTLNLTSVTVLNQTSIEMFKKIKSGLKYHISVNTPINTIDDLKKQFNIEDIYCINLRYNHIFDLSLMDKLKDLGIKVKIIPNEMCVFGREDFFEKIHKKACVKNKYCKEKCWDILVGDLEWLNLTRQGFTKSFIPYFKNKVDIIKLSTRGGTLKSIDELLNSFIYENSEECFNRYLIPKYKYHDFIKMRLSCNHDCFKCLYCKSIFDKYVKGENDEKRFDE